MNFFSTELYFPMSNLVFWPLALQELDPNGQWDRLDIWKTVADRNKAKLPRSNGH
jgi:hypothetical protein